MTNKEAIQYLEIMRTLSDTEEQTSPIILEKQALDLAIKALEQTEVDKGYQEGHIDGVLQAEKLYARPTGKWIMNKTSVRGRNYTCTSCGNKSRNAFHFCPNCGADMRGEEE